jgi:hypothetical protein
VNVSEMSGLKVLMLEAGVGYGTAHAACASAILSKKPG